MTIVAAIRDGKRSWIASDSMASDLYHKFDAGSKLIQFSKGLIIGFAGTFEARQWLEAQKAALDLTQSPESLLEAITALWKASPCSGCYLLAATPSIITTFYDNGQRIDLNDPIAAIGSGAEACLASLEALRLSMKPSKALEKSLEATFKHIATTGGPIHIKEVK